MLSDRFDEIKNEDFTFDLTTFAMQLIVVSFSLILLPAVLASLLYVFKVVIFLPDTFQSWGIEATMLVILGTIVISFLFIDPLKKYLIDVGFYYLLYLGLLQQASDPVDERDVPEATIAHLVALYGLSVTGLIVYGGVKQVIASLTDGQAVFLVITNHGYFAYETIQIVLLDIVSLGSILMTFATGLLAGIYTPRIIRRSGVLQWLRSRWVVRKLGQTIVGVWWEYIFRRR